MESTSIRGDDLTTPNLAEQTQEPQELISLMTSVEEEMVEDDPYQLGQSHVKIQFSRGEATECCNIIFQISIIEMNEELQ